MTVDQLADLSIGLNILIDVVSSVCVFTEVYICLGRLGTNVQCLGVMFVSVHIRLHLKVFI